MTDKKSLVKQSKWYMILALVLCSFSSTIAEAADHAVSGVYVGGHIRRERPGTIAKLRESGFTYAILFNVDVQTDGTLKTDGETICQNGEYVFQRTQPHYVEDVIALKTQPTSISRLEICIGGWGNQSYVNIKNLVNKYGTGPETMLYKNFKALLETVPGIDAVNNDDEHGYDVETAAKFHIMMSDLGLHTTLAPYTNKNFWTQLATKVNSQRPGCVDRVMIQCYDGGAYNNPLSWNFSGIERHAGRTNYQTSMEESIKQMENWAQSGAATGAFVWVYNDETWDLNAWASAMNRTYVAREVKDEDAAAWAYSDKNFTGYKVALPVGKHTIADLAVLGLKANDLESMEVKDGYNIQIHKGKNCDGASWPVRRNAKSFTSTWANLICSISIEPKNPDAISNYQAEESQLSASGNIVTVTNACSSVFSVSDLSGRLVMQTVVTERKQDFSLSPLPRGIYVVKVGDRKIKVNL